MSTRGSIFYHEDKVTGVTIHIYEEAWEKSIHLEVAHAHGVTNVLWPHNEFLAEVKARNERLAAWRPEPSN